MRLVDVTGPVNVYAGSGSIAAERLIQLRAGSGDIDVIGNDR